MIEKMPRSWFAGYLPVSILDKVLAPSGVVYPIIITYPNEDLRIQQILYYLIAYTPKALTPYS